MAEEADDIEDLREQKKEELKDQQESQEDALEEQKKRIKKQAAQYLTGEAQSRLGNIRAADPEKAASIEMQIARIGKMGRVDKIDDDQLKDILKSINEEEEKNETDIKFRR